MGVLEDIISRDQELIGHGRWLHGATNDSLVVDTEKQIFFWNSQGIVGDAFIWLTRVKGMTPDQARIYLRDSSKFIGSFIYEIHDNQEVVVYPKLVDVFYENGISAPRDYWEKRGISNETISRFKLGFFEDWYTIPIYMDGLFKNFQMRREKPEKRIRYYYKDTADKRLLFNSDILKLTNKIIIAEGPTDALRLLQEGVPCISHTAGSEGWKDEWYKYFIHQKKIYVVYDNDKAGREGAKKVAKNLGIYRTKIYTFDGYEDKYDIVDYFRDGFPLSRLLELIEKESKYVFEL